VLQNKDVGLLNNASLQEEIDLEKEMRENRERELKEIMARKVRFLSLLSESCMSN